MREFAKGLADYERARRIDPNEMGVPLKRAVALYNKGDTDAAFRACNDVLQDKPKPGEERHFAPVYAARGRLFVDKGRMEQAITDFAEATRLDAKLYAGYLGRGECLLETLQYKNALADFCECVRLRPTDPVGYEWRAATYRMLGQRKTAETDEAAARRLRESK